MYISVFTDELKQEVTSILPTFAQWGMEYVDFRGLINGAPIERQTTEQLKALKAQMDSLGLKTGVIQSSLCKKHLPDADVVICDRNGFIILCSDALTGCDHEGWQVNREYLQAVYQNGSDSSTGVIRNLYADDFASKQLKAQFILQPKENSIIR